MANLRKERERPSIDRLRAVLNYDPLSGIFTWLVTMNGHVKAGSQAGGMTVGKNKGYIVISVDGSQYPAHHIAWAIQTGNWPAEEIDHKDLVRHNNVWTNLREATRAQNQGNVRVRVDSKTGVKGVSMQKKGGRGKPRYRARIQVNGVRAHLGYFPTAEAANAAYAKLAENVFGEFARVA